MYVYYEVAEVNLDNVTARREGITGCDSQLYVEFPRASDVTDVIEQQRGAGRHKAETATNHAVVVVQLRMFYASESLMSGLGGGLLIE